MFSAQALRPHLCFVCARIFAIHTAAPHAAHTKSVQALSCFRINDCRAAHTVCQRFQKGKSFSYSGFTDSGTEQFFFAAARPSSFVAVSIWYKGKSGQQVIPSCLTASTLNWIKLPRRGHVPRHGAAWKSSPVPRCSLLQSSPLRKYAVRFTPWHRQDWNAFSRCTIPFLLP